MKQNKKIRLLIAFCLSLFFIQCNSDDNKIEEKVIAEKETTEISLLRNYLSASFGLEIKKIIYDSSITTFVIDGDMLMSLEDARERLNQSNSEITSKTNQRVTTYHMNPEASSLLQVYVSPEVSPEWKIAITQAINNWNTVNSSIAITVVNTSTAKTINITTYNETNTTVIAASYVPTYDGQPGKLIKINTFFNTLAASKKINAMTHEFGHAFGFHHIDELTATLIPCTPLSDGASVMFPIVQDWLGFSYYDIVAVSTLYPVAVGTKKLYRFKKNQYYFYTTNPCEITPSKDGYVFDGDAGYLYSTQISGTVPLYRILNGTTVKDHRLSTVQTSASDIVLGYLYPTQQPRTTPLYSTISSYEYFPSNKHYLCTTIFDKSALIMLPIGYVCNKIIQNYKPNDINF